jgi:hypothetical protein
MTNSLIITGVDEIAMTHEIAGGWKIWQLCPLLYPTSDIIRFVLPHIKYHSICSFWHQIWCHLLFWHQMSFDEVFWRQSWFPLLFRQVVNFSPQNPHLLEATVTSTVWLSRWTTCVNSRCIEANVYFRKSSQCCHCSITEYFNVEISSYLPMRSCSYNASGVRDLKWIAYHMTNSKVQNDDSGCSISWARNSWTFEKSQRIPWRSSTTGWEISSRQKIGTETNIMMLSSAGG